MLQIDFERELSMNVNSLTYYSFLYSKNVIAAPLTVLLLFGNDAYFCGVA